MSAFHSYGFGDYAKMKRKISKKPNHTKNVQINSKARETRRSQFAFDRSHKWSDACASMRILSPKILILDAYTKLVTEYIKLDAHLQLGLRYRKHTHTHLRTNIWQPSHGKTGHFSVFAMLHQM